MQTTVLILSYLAKNQSQNKWVLSKKLEKSYGNIHASVKILLENNTPFIRIEHTEPSSKNPKARINFYGLTLHGVLEGLIDNSKLWEKIDVIAEIHQDKLRIFKKWKFFEIRGLKESIKAAMMSFLASIEMTQSSLMLVSRRIEWTEEELKNIVDSAVLGVHEIRTRKEPSNLFSEILKAAKEDKELKEFIINELNQAKNITLNTLKRLEEGLKLMKNNRK